MFGGSTIGARVGAWAAAHGRALRALAVALLVLVVIQNAWVCDDAFISFRMVDNWLGGRGLTWNPGERVCASTHPLWMLLHALPMLLTDQVFYVTIALGVAATIAATAIVCFRIATSTALAALAVLMLVSSKAFVDYSTSGLENPLTHLIVAGFFSIFLGGALTVRRFGWLSLLWGLALLNRMDTGLLYLPAVAYAAVRLGVWRCLPRLAVGLLPFLGWEVFSVLYYGFPFPNTAYAKLNTGIAAWAMMRQGLVYLLDACTRDPVTAGGIVCGLAMGFASPDGRRRCLAGGAALYLVYVVWIGGDFMAGRFLTAPLLLATMIVCSSPAMAAGRRAIVAAILTGLMGMLASYPPVLTGPRYAARQPIWVADSGIADERGCYCDTSSLLATFRHNRMPDGMLRRSGEELAQDGPDTVALHAVGFLGYYAGPRVHVVDVMALCDPLLARLPATQRAGGWRIGHFRRAVPAGYLQSLRTGGNAICDPALSQYYDRLRRVIGGSIFAPGRLAEIWRLNTGAYDHWLDAYANAPQGRALLADTPEPSDGDSPASAPAGGPTVSHAGIRLDLPEISHTYLIRIGPIKDDAFLVELRRGDRCLDSYRLRLPEDSNRAAGLASIRVPRGAIVEGYDNLRLIPLDDCGVDRRPVPGVRLIPPARPIRWADE